MAERLPPPPFWRTLYYEFRASVRSDRRDIEPGYVQRVIDQPTRRDIQADGRFRLWGYVVERQRWLRVIVEPDGETVHNAFWDRKFRP
jgi:hypothetical protein